MKRKRTRSKRTRNRKRGGTKYFYSYNTKPLMFTNTSTQQGGFLGMGDPRYTLLPNVANDALQNLQYSLSSSANSYAGNYQGVNSNWRIQPIK